MLLGRHLCVKWWTSDHSVLSPSLKFSNLSSRSRSWHNFSEHIRCDLLARDRWPLDVISKFKTSPGAVVFPNTILYSSRRYTHRGNAKNVFFVIVKCDRWPLLYDVINLAGTTYLIHGHLPTKFMQSFSRKRLWHMDMSNEFSGSYIFPSTNEDIPFFQKKFKLVSKSRLGSTYRCEVT